MWRNEGLDSGKCLQIHKCGEGVQNYVDIFWGICGADKRQTLIFAEIITIMREHGVPNYSYNKFPM